MPVPHRVLRPGSLDEELLDFRKRLFKLETVSGRPFSLISTPGNSATQNQVVPSDGGNFNGLFGTKYDVAMSTPCVFTLQAPTPIIWFSHAAAKVSNPGGGNFVFYTTAVSLSPWNPAAWIIESGSQIFDVGASGFAFSNQQLVIGNAQPEGAVGPGAAALGVSFATPILPAGTYEVRQRATGDSGTVLTLHDGFIDVFATAG